MTDLTKSETGKLISIAAQIHKAIGRGVEASLDVGRELNNARDVLANHSDGVFVGWLESEFPMSRSTAYEWMANAREFGGKISFPLSGKLEVKALTVLSKNDTPKKAKNEALRLLDKGKPLTAKVAKELKAKHITQEQVDERKQGQAASTESAAEIGGVSSGEYGEQTGNSQEPLGSVNRKPGELPLSTTETDTPADGGTDATASMATTPGDTGSHEASGGLFTLDANVNRLHNLLKDGYTMGGLQAAMYLTMNDLEAVTLRVMAMDQFGLVEKPKEAEFFEPVKMPPKRGNFQPPSLAEVRAYCTERGKGIDADQWYDHYTANGWKVGRNAMKDWKAAVRTWEKNGKPDGKTLSPKNAKADI